MRFISTLSDKFFSLLDGRIDRAVSRCLLNDKYRLASAVAEQIDAAAVAKHVCCATVADSLDMHEVAEQVADRVDIDHSDIATRLARNLDMDDVVSHVVGEIDMAQVCEQCAERIEVDEEEVIRRAADFIADNTDSDDVASKVAENLDLTEQVAERLAENDKIDYDRLARALLRTIAKTAML